MKKCHFCAEEIQDEAVICRHCGRDLNAPTPRNTAAVGGLIEKKMQQYIFYDYKLVSRTDKQILLERQSPRNPLILIALIIMFLPASIVYAFPSVRKEYRVQLKERPDGRVDEFGGNILMFKRDKKKANRTGMFLIVIAIMFIIAIFVSLGME